MKKTILILVLFVGLVACQKQTTCILTNTYTTNQPSEGFPKVETFVYNDPFTVDNYSLTKQVCLNGKEVTLQSNYKCK